MRPVRGSPAPLLRQRLALLQKRVEPRLLVGDAVGGTRFVRGTRVGRGLLHELAQIIAEDGYALFEIGERFGVGQVGVPRVIASF